MYCMCKRCVSTVKYFVEGLCAQTLLYALNMRYVFLDTVINCSKYIFYRAYRHKDRSLINSATHTCVYWCCNCLCKKVYHLFDIYGLTNTFDLHYE